MKGDESKSDIGIIRLPPEEFADRRKSFMKEVGKDRTEGVCLFGTKAIFYFTGFSFYLTERPIALVITKDCKTILFAPLLEKEHAEAIAHVDVVESYPEYPGETHPMDLLTRLLSSEGYDKGRLGIDSDGYPGCCGYKGPRLSELLSLDLRSVKELIEVRAQIKSHSEIALLRESARWAYLAQRLLQGFTAPGLMETEVSLQASNEASRQMVEALGANYRVTHWGFIPAIGKYRGQVGRQSAIPHTIATGTRIQEGDLLVSTASADVGGYSVELERTLIVGEPTKDQKKFFSLMLEAQKLGFEMIRPGIPCSEVDRRIRRFYVERGVDKYWRHHTGHSIGILEHESPFLDIGDNTMIEPNMVFTIEPGLYVPGLGGFRHSDTVLVNERGNELLTHYPRSLEELTVQCQ